MSKKSIIFGSLWFIFCSLTYSSIITIRPTTIVYKEPIDAVSFSIPEHSTSMQLRSNIDGKWSNWQTLEVETEFDPNLQETNLIIFPKPVYSIQVKNNTSTFTANPLRIGMAPAMITAAGLLPTSTPKILTRRQWGANDSFLIDGSSNATTAKAIEDETTTHEDECADLQKSYPNDFAISSTVTKNNEGKLYRWPKQYSNKISLIAIHHTAALNTGDTRSGWEKMQLLYAYHANSRKWGDIGYNFVIDSSGQIYEGRDGGKFVVGGHAYCNNVSTLGIALMGNFNEEEPSSAQVKSLQWLLIKLTDEYNIKPGGTVQYHGKNMPTIIGHRDVRATACPGEVLYSGIAQIKSNVARGNFSQPVIFPVTPKTNTITASNIANKKSTTPLIAAIGSTTLTGRPGGSINFSILVKAGTTSVQKKQSIATVGRSDTKLGIWQKNGAGDEIRIRDNLLVTQYIAPNEIITEKLRVQLPREGGTITATIGSIVYTFKAEGQRTPSATPKILPSTTGQTKAALVPNRTASQPSTRQISNSSMRTNLPNIPSIRIKLSVTGNEHVISSEGGAGTIQGNSSFSIITLKNENNVCTAYNGKTKVASGIVTITGKNNVKIDSWNTSLNRFRGSIECQIIDGTIVLINELSIEEYLSGLSEQPDTQPYEKQRAFAIAARSYAGYYISNSNRKFPGKPYDGSDSPAEFQKYSGLSYEEKNPNWVKAVKSTYLQVITKNNTVIKTPYFSSDEGHTLTPAERGWGNFPFPEVFNSKPDPWCEGLKLSGHGVGMSGCGAKGQALEGKKAEEILQYYYPTTQITTLGL